MCSFSHQQAPPRTATYRMARGCARRSQAHNSWNLKGSFPRICISQDSEESKLPRIWICQRNRWKSGFRTAEWSTRKREKPPKGAHTAVASAQPVTQTIQGQRTRSLYLRPLLRKRKRCHLSESNSPIPTAGTYSALLQLWVMASRNLWAKNLLHEVWEEILTVCYLLHVYPAVKLKERYVNIYYWNIWKHDLLYCMCNRLMWFDPLRDFPYKPSKWTPVNVSIIAPYPINVSEA